MFCPYLGVALEARHTGQGLHGFVGCAAICPGGYVGIEACAIDGIDVGEVWWTIATTASGSAATTTIGGVVGWDVDDDGEVVFVDGDVGWAEVVVVVHDCGLVAEEEAEVELEAFTDLGVDAA